MAITQLQQLDTTLGLSYEQAEKISDQRIATILLYDPEYLHIIPATPAGQRPIKIIFPDMEKALSERRNFLVVVHTRALKGRNSPHDGCTLVFGVLRRGDGSYRPVVHVKHYKDPDIDSNGDDEVPGYPLFGVNVGYENPEFTAAGIPVAALNPKDVMATVIEMEMDYRSLKGEGDNTNWLA